MPIPRKKFKQIVVGQWTSQDRALNHSVYGISEDGYVYRLTSQGWVDAERAKERRSPAPIDNDEPF